MITELLYCAAPQLRETVIESGYLQQVDNVLKLTYEPAVFCATVDFVIQFAQLDAPGDNLYKKVLLEKGFDLMISAAFTRFSSSPGVEFSYNEFVHKLTGKHNGNPPDHTHILFSVATGLKLSYNGLRIRNGGYSFASAKTNIYAPQKVSSHWYYECRLESQDLMQIGWATADSIWKPLEGKGVGDDVHSYALDLLRMGVWNDTKTNVTTAGIGKWKVGDIIGCGINFTSKQLEWRLNGIHVITYNFSTEDASNPNVKFYPAMSLPNLQHITLLLVPQAKGFAAEYKYLGEYTLAELEQ